MADKYLYNNNGVITEKSGLVSSSGAGDAGKIPALDNSGRIDVTLMPVGITPETAVIATSENLSSGDFVNVWNNGGNFAVRKADASSAGKEAHGFVLSSFTHPTSAVVYFEGTNTAVIGKSPGNQFLSTIAGLTSNVAPTSAGQIVQKVGVATSATSINVEFGPVIVLA
jgi:hypothetical protein